MNKPRKIKRSKEVLNNTEEWIQFTVRMDKAVRDELRILAKRKNIQLREALTYACKEYIKKHNK